MNDPAVTYPCRWSFTLIGTDAEAIGASAEACLAGGAYRLVPSRQSRGGKYVSLHLDTDVASEEARNRLFACLKSAPAIKMII